MKRIIALLLTFAVLLSLTACINITVNGKDPAGADVSEQADGKKDGKNADPARPADLGDASDTEAFIRDTLAKAEALGKTKAALDLLEAATKQVDDWRILGAYRTLYSLQWKEAGFESVSAESILTRETTWNEDGTVKTYKDTTVFLNLDYTSELYYKQTYDKAGNLLEEIWYEGEGPDYIFIQNNEYDENGNITKAVAYEYGELRLDDECTYDEYGNLLTRSEINQNYIYDENEESSYVYARYDCKNEYDADGNLIRVTQIGDDGAVRKVTERDYNERGKCVAERVFDGEGNLKKRFEFKYSGYGQREETYTYGPDGAILNGWKKEFNDEHRCVKQDYYTKDGVLEYTIEWTYDENGCVKTEDHQAKLPHPGDPDAGEYTTSVNTVLYTYNWEFFPLP